MPARTGGRLVASASGRRCRCRRAAPWIRSRFTPPAVNYARLDGLVGPPEARLPDRPDPADPGNAFRGRHEWRACRPCPRTTVQAPSRPRRSLLRTRVTRVPGSVNSARSPSAIRRSASRPRPWSARRARPARRSGKSLEVAALRRDGVVVEGSGIGQGRPVTVPFSPLSSVSGDREVCWVPGKPGREVGLPGSGQPRETRRAPPSASMMVPVRLALVAASTTTSAMSSAVATRRAGRTWATWVK